MGEGTFRPPENPHPLTDHQKKLLIVITSATPTAVPNMVQIRLRGFLGECVNYNDFIYLFICLYLFIICSRV